jgi:hypothetical protein
MPSPSAAVSGFGYPTLQSALMVGSCRVLRHGREKAPDDSPPQTLGRQTPSQPGAAPDVRVRSAGVQQADQGGAWTLVGRKGKPVRRTGPSAHRRVRSHRPSTRGVNVETLRRKPEVRPACRAVRDPAPSLAPRSVPAARWYPGSPVSYSAALRASPQPAPQRLPVGPPAPQRTRRCVPPQSRLHSAAASFVRAMESSPSFTEAVSASRRYDAVVRWESLRVWVRNGLWRQSSQQPPNRWDAAEKHGGQVGKGRWPRGRGSPSALAGLTYCHKPLLCMTLLVVASLLEGELESQGARERRVAEGSVAGEDGELESEAPDDRTDEAASPVLDPATPSPPLPAPPAAPPCAAPPAPATPAEAVEARKAMEAEAMRIRMEKEAVYRADQRKRALARADRRREVKVRRRAEKAGCQPPEAVGAVGSHPTPCSGHPPSHTVPTLLRGATHWPAPLVGVSSSPQPRKLMRVRGDGNCQFRALALALLGDQSLHHVVRRAVATELWQNTTRYFDYVVGASAEAYGEYVRGMERDHAWGDHVTLRAAAEVYGCNVVVVTREGKGFGGSITRVTDVAGRDEIWLAYTPNVHYDCLVEVGGRKASAGSRQSARARWEVMEEEATALGAVRAAPCTPDEGDRPAKGSPPHVGGPARAGSDTPCPPLVSPPPQPPPNNAATAATIALAPPGPCSEKGTPPRPPSGTGLRQCAGWAASKGRRCRIRVRAVGEGRPLCWHHRCQPLSVLEGPEPSPPVVVEAEVSHARVLPCEGYSPTSGQLRGGGGYASRAPESPTSGSEDGRDRIRRNLRSTMARVNESGRAQPSPTEFHIRDIASRPGRSETCGFCDPSVTYNKRVKRGLQKINEHFERGTAARLQCERRLGPEGMAEVHRVRRCEVCSRLRFVNPGVSCGNKRCASNLASSPAAGPSGVPAARGSANRQVRVSTTSQPGASRPAIPECEYCASLDTRQRTAGDIVQHLNRWNGGGVCVERRWAAEWRNKGVYVCGCRKAFTALTWKKHKGCGHSGVGPSGVSIGEGRPIPPSDNGGEWLLHPTPMPPHRPHYPASATARVCPPAAHGGCGSSFSTFAQLFTHLKTTSCGDSVQGEALRGLGVKRCGKSNANGTCRALLETHTAGTVWAHQRICNFRDDVNEGRPPPPPPPPPPPQVGGAVELPPPPPPPPPPPGEGVDPPPPPRQVGAEEEQLGVRVPRESWELLMSLDMLLLSNAPGPTFGYIPDRVKHLVEGCWTFASREALRPATAERGFRLLQAFSSMLLLRKRGDHVSAREAVTRRCRLFMSGEWEALLSYARAGAPRGPRRGEVERPGTQLGRRVKRALVYASKGELSKATATLEAAPMAPPSMEVLRQLQALHPAPDLRIHRPERPPGTPALVLDRELFDAYVSELPRLRAPGCSGFRLEHLQAIVSAGGRDTLYSLCNHILAGGVPAAVRPYFAGAKLFALEKPQGGIRPIACGEVLRRVVATLVCRQLRTQCAEFFASGPQGAQQVPAQLGVGVQGGGEVVVHGLQVAMEANPTWALCTVDWKNAFNACSRARMLQEVSVHFPALYPFVEACYAVDPVMVYGIQGDRGMELHTIMSSDGTQQGDPLGPLLFALLLHPVLRATMEAHPGLTMLPSFLDDTGIPGPPALVAEAFKTLVELGREMAGLTVNQSKCRVYSADPGADFTGFPQEVQGASGARLLGVTVLSAAIGKDEWVEQQIRETAVKATGVLPSLHSLGDPQTAYLLLSACIRPRIVHLLRACKPELCREAMRMFHETLLSSLAGPDAVVMKGLPLDWLAKRFVSLPARVGGLGFIRGERLADAAFLGSFALVWPVVLRLFPLAVPAGALLEAVAGNGTLGALRGAHRRVAEEEERVKALLAGLPADIVLARGVRDRPSIPPLTAWQEEAAKGVQKMLSWVSMSLDYLDLRSEVVRGVDVRSRAWFSSVTSPDSIGNSLFRCVPAYPALRLNPSLFPVAARAYLFQHQPAVGLVTSCNTCQNEVDREGSHYLTCKPPTAWKLGNPNSCVHDGVVRTLGEGLRKVFPGPGRVSVESRDYSEQSQGHRPDIVVEEGNERGDTLLVEVSVIRPMARQHLGAAAEGGALRAHELFRRERHYPARELAPGTAMVPFVADVFGCLGPESARFFHKMADTQRGWDEPVELRGVTWKERWCRRVAISIARAVAKAIHERGVREQEMVRPTEVPRAYNGRSGRP